MSFTTDVKAEIAQIETTLEEKKVELSALVQLCATLNFTSEGAQIVVQIENANTAKRIWKLVKDCYGIDGQLSVIKKVKLKKNNIYVIRIQQEALHILNDLQIMDEDGFRKCPRKDFVKGEKFAKSYVRGCFLASGSVNSPIKADYHLEIAVNTREFAEYLQSLLKKYTLDTKIVKRRNLEVVYMKASERISDFLKFISANEAVFIFEDRRINRSFANSLTRLDNCEVANEVKVFNAASRQLDDIEWIENYQSLDTLDEKLKRVALLRKDNPEESLLDLSILYTKIYEEEISKSGMKHRFTKLKELANQYRGESKE